MHPSDPARRLQGWRLAIRIGVLALVVGSTLPFGSVHPLWIAVVEGWAACLAAAAVWVLYRDPDCLPPGARRLAIPAIVLVGIGILQWVPLPKASVLAPPTALARESVASVLPELSFALAPYSLSPPETLDAGLRLVAYLLVGFAAVVGFVENRHVRQAAWTIALLGGGQALYGAAEYLSGHQHILGHAKQYYLNSATGTFINRNHFAGYLAMTLPFALRFLVGPRRRGTLRTWRKRLILALEPTGARRFMGGLAAFLIVVGVFLSYSRGGLAAALIGAAVFVRIVSRGRRKLWVLLVLFLVPAAFLSFQEVRAPGERFVTDAAEISTLNNRIPVWGAAVGMVPSYLWLGSGYGTFEFAFRTHQPASLEGRWVHAHNDWLQVLIEGGLPALAALLAAAAMLVLTARASWAPTLDARILVGCPVAALTAIACHSVLDFTLRIPAAALLLTLQIALLLVAERVRQPSTATS